MTFAERVLHKWRGRRVMLWVGNKTVGPITRTGLLIAGEKDWLELKLDPSTGHDTRIVNAAHIESAVLEKVQDK